MMDYTEKVDKSIALIREYEPYAEMAGGYHVGFSGGKDSQCLLQLFKESGVKYRAVYNVTTNDPPANVDFIRKNYPEVEFSFPELNFWQLMKKKKTIPSRLKRFCCSYFKERSGTFAALGVRREESLKRRDYPFIVLENKRNFDKPTYKGQRVRFYPIIEWTESEVWEFIESRNLPINPLYETFGRVGCMLCPYANKRQILYWFRQYPKLRTQFLNTISEMMDNGFMNKYPTATPESVLEWWMSSQNANMFFNQTKLDF